MKRPLALAGLSLFLLIGAAYPEAPQLHYGAAVMAGTSDVTGPTYRPCRRDRRDDRCIQLYERGVRAAYAQWLNEHGVGGPDDRIASHEPRPERARHQRRERIAMTEVRCVTTRDHRGDEAHRDHGDHQRREMREHREHREQREHQDHRDGEVRGM